MSKWYHILLATLAALLLSVTSAVVATPAAAAPGMKVLARGSGNGTALLFGGTGQPSGAELSRTIGMKSVPRGAKVIAVRTTANFFPAFGAQSYNDSKYDGARRIVWAIKHTPGKKTVVTYSLSTVSMDIALRQLRRQGYDMRNLTVVKIANARRNGPTKGIETVYPTFNVPGITSGGAEARTGVRTVDICGQYDPVCDAPRPGSPLESYVNAVICYFQCHGYYSARDLRGRRAVVERRGNTTYITYRRVAPLTQMTGIRVPDSLARHRVSAPVTVRRTAAATVPAPRAATPAYVPQVVVPQVQLPKVSVPTYTPPPAPVVTQRQVTQVQQQVVKAVPQAAPIVKAVTSNPVVSGFLKGLPR